MVAPYVKRPTSPLHFEPIYVPPEDVLFPGSDCDELEDRHLKKRRRIEELGQKVLEGKPLLIASASLRGPLDEGWVNPWANKKRKTASNSSVPKESGSRNRHSTNREPTELQRTEQSEKARFDFSKDARRSVVSDLGLRPPRSADTDNVAEAQRARSTGFGGQVAQNIFPPAVAQIHVRRSDDFGSAKPAAQGSSRPAGSEPERSATRLKSDSRYLKAHTEDDVRPSTPSPSARSSPPAMHYSGFTPINKPAAPVHSVAAGSHSVSKESRPLVPTRAPPVVREGTERSAFREINFAEADQCTRAGYISAKELSQKAVAKARDEEGGLQARKLSQEAALQGSQKALEAGNEPLSHQPPSAEYNEKAVAVAEHPQNHLGDSKATPHQLPPSTNLVEFRYRLANKRPTSSSEKVTSNNTSFALQMKAAKAKAEAQSLKRLSFTSSGRIKSFGSRSTSRASSISSARREPVSSKQLIETGSSEGQTGGPEAQQVLAPPAHAEALPSAPSMHALANGADEGDSYLNLSTQAAISKAQHSFQKDIATSLQTTPKRSDGVGISQPSPTAYKTPIESWARIPLSLTKAVAPNLDTRTPVGDALSTQAMMDAISPFAVTTIKPSSPSKPAHIQIRSSFAHSPLASPSRAFGTTRRSLSMSTSSDSSSPVPNQPRTKPTTASKPPPMLSKTSSGMAKPPSTATSTAFSIAPNGTLTEVYQHDGQQLYDAAIGTGMDGWDLDEAIEEAGSFLATGAWDVEVEARKEGNVAAKATAS